MALVSLTIAAILSGAEAEPDWPMGWTIFLFLDFPVSLLLFIVESAGSALPSHVQLISGYSPVNDVWNFLVPAPFFALVGSVWWFLLVRWFQRLPRARTTGV